MARLVPDILGEEYTTTDTCVLHREHSPRVLMCAKWHLFPIMLQGVSGIKQKDIDATYVAMCPTGAVNVCVALQDLLSHGRFEANYSTQEKHFAWKAFDAYSAALADRDEERKK